MNYYRTTSTTIKRERRRLLISSTLHFDSKISAGDKLENFEAVLDRQIRNDYKSVAAYVDKIVADNFDTK